MDSAAGFIRERISSVKVSQLGYIFSLPIEDEIKRNRVNKIIAEKAAELAGLEWAIELIEVTKGVNPKIVGQLVDSYRSEGG